MKSTEYCSSLTEAEFELIKPCLKVQRRSKWNLLGIVNAIFYVCDGGIKWRDVPHDFSVPWQTVYWYFQKWVSQGVWQHLNDELVMCRRVQKGADPVPSFSVIDAQSVHNAQTATNEVGVDMGKRTKGRKRLILVDSQGHLLCVRVVGAGHHDGTAALKWWSEEVSMLPLLSEIERLYGDMHFGGRFKKGVEEKGLVKVITTHQLAGISKNGMKVHKNRWVVERTFAWELNSRRLSRDFERKTQHSEAFCLISSINRMIKNPINMN